MANSADQDQKPTDLDLHCLQRQGISEFIRTRVRTRFWVSKTGRIPRAVFLLTVPRWFFVCPPQVSYVTLFGPYLFLVFPSFGALGGHFLCTFTCIVLEKNI